jgi:hypothetical protein
MVMIEADHGLAVQCLAVALAHVNTWPFPHQISSEHGKIFHPR